MKPHPLPDTTKISTSSRFFLKYCATIMDEQSRVMLTPTPTINPRSEMIVELLLKLIVFPFLIKNKINIHHDKYIQTNRNSRKSDDTAMRMM